MEKCTINHQYRWKIIFVIFISVIAFIGYRYSNVTMSNPVVSSVDSSENMATISKNDLYPIIHDYIMNHPEVILESMEQMQKRKAEEMSAQMNNIIRDNKEAIEDISNSPYAGNKDGDIKIIMFYDYSCGYCKKANDSLNQFLDSDKNIMVIYRPIAVLGEQSDYIAKIMLAIQNKFPDKFKLVHDAILNVKQITKDDIALIINQNSLSMDILEKEIASKEVEAMKMQNAKLADSIKVNGVPVFVIDTGFYQGAMDLDTFVTTVDNIRKSR